jgi:hypothetical protein
MPETARAVNAMELTLVHVGNALRQSPLRASTTPGSSIRRPRRLLRRAPCCRAAGTGCAGLRPRAGHDREDGHADGPVAWRARLLDRTPVWSSRSVKTRRSRGSIEPGEASWLLVLGAAGDDLGRCWLRVRLPSRPNNAAAWVNADRVRLRPTPWRIHIPPRPLDLAPTPDSCGWMLSPVRSFADLLGGGRERAPASSGVRRR